MSGPIIGGEREYLDQAGVQWRVVEVDARSVPAAQRDRCLLFCSISAIRRVWQYPDEWFGVEPDELTTISWRT
jgi:hypothetical protein